MKAMIMAVLLAATLAGCAGQSWDAYASQHACAYSGDQAHRREFISHAQPTSNGAVTLSPAPVLQFRPVYKYNCSNGVMWSYNAPHD